MSTTTTTTEIIIPNQPAAPSSKVVANQEIVHQQAVALHQEVQQTFLRLLQEGSAQVLDTLKYAAKQVSAGSFLAALKAEDAAINEVLQLIEEQRALIQARLEEKKLSEAVKKRYRQQLDQLDAREQAALTALDQIFSKVPHNHG